MKMHFYHSQINFHTSSWEKLSTSVFNQLQILAKISKISFYLRTTNLKQNLDFLWRRSLFPTLYVDIGCCTQRISSLCGRPGCSSKNIFLLLTLFVPMEFPIKFDTVK